MKVLGGVLSSALPVALAVMLASCSVDHVVFSAEPKQERCAQPGDEDGNGLADCADSACAAEPACMAPRCTAEVCDGMDNDCDGVVDNKQAVGSQPDCAATSCADVMTRNPAQADGPWWISAQGARPYRAYCDMTGGGWTLVMNQVPAAPLPDSTATVNEAAMGTLDQSYRFGGAAMARVRPAVAWKLNDAQTSVYFAPECAVDWNVNYLGQPASPCTLGYTTEQRTTPVNGGFINVSTRGIGINNSAQICSIRAYNVRSDGNVETGPATSCQYRTDQRVQLWFR